jgi:lysophospholipase L1-like esterase
MNVRVILFFAVCTFAGIFFHSYVFRCFFFVEKLVRSYVFRSRNTTSYLFSMTEKQQQKPLRILALGDSLTEGYYDYGRRYHPYATHLTHLFESANIPVKIDQLGRSGERVVPNMVNRLRYLLKQNASYDWIIILGGTNDLGGEVSADKIFGEGLKPMYEMCLNQTQAKINLAAMTVIENGYDSPTNDSDKDRQTLNRMIRDYIAKINDQDRVCLVDLDKGIPYHSKSDDNERKRIWDDDVHLTPAGYDRMATLVFDAIKSKL